MKELNFRNMYTHEFEKILEQEMDAPIKHFERELATIRTGRAHPSMVEDIKVTCYGGSILAIKEVAAISTPEARLLVVQPWDPSIMADIEKAIIASPIGITPANDGNIIRIVLPEISSQRRDDLAKALGKKLEDCRESIRAIRGNYRTAIKESERAHTIEEDFSKKLQDILQKITDKFTDKAQQLSDKKEKDIKAV